MAAAAAEEAGAAAAAGQARFPPRTPKRRFERLPSVATWLSAPTEAPFDPTSSDLHHFHPHPAAGVFEAIEEGRLTKVRKIAGDLSCGAGGVYIYRLRRAPPDGDLAVAVKKMPNRIVEACRRLPTNDRAAFYRGNGQIEDPLTEIGVLLHLNALPDMCPYLIRFVALSRDAGDTLLATELCDGDLFSVAVSAQAGGLPEEQTKAFMWQFLQAVSYLHSRNVGHCDIALENVLVTRGELRVMDFGQAVQLHEHGIPQLVYRYFRPRGRGQYRAPEARIPQTAPPWAAPCPPTYTAGTVVVVQHGGFLVEVVFRPGFVLGQTCPCDCSGYAAAAVDVFACGVFLFMLHSQQAPWGSTTLADQSFRFICVNGVGPLWLARGTPLLSNQGMELLGRLLLPHPATRPSIRECLSHAWFADLRQGAAAAAAAMP